VPTDELEKKLLAVEQRDKKPNIADSKRLHIVCKREFHGERMGRKKRKKAYKHFLGDGNTKETRKTTRQHLH